MAPVHILPVSDLLPLKKLGGKIWNVVGVGAGADDVKVEKIHEKDALAVTYHKGSYASDSGKPGGLGFYAAPTAVFPAKHVIFKYKFRPNSTWKPNLGGKLPGLSIGERGASGGKFAVDGAGIRLMWRREGALEAYTYPASDAHQDAAYKKLPGFVDGNGHGDSIWRGEWTLKTDEWNTVELEVKSNTPKKQDGLLRLTINGKTRSYDKMAWSGSKALDVSCVYECTFYGGNDSSWAAPTDCKMWFTDHSVQKIA